MEKQNIQPDRITKPIQLLGAWLVGLLTIDATFLFAATNMDSTSWHAGALTIAAIVNVPIFIGALFVLQTKFRPELQEDSYYATYLNSRTNEMVRVPKNEVLLEELVERFERREERTSGNVGVSGHSVLSQLSFAVNLNLTNHDAIDDVLSEAGVEVFREFGEGSGRPEQLKVAVAAYLSPQIKNEVFRLAKKIGIEHYSTIQPWEQIEEDVLIGAYGETEGRIAIKTT
jgi:hypothetical protein